MRSSPSTFVRFAFCAAVASALAACGGLSSTTIPTTGAAPAMSKPGMLGVASAMATAAKAPAPAPTATSGGFTEYAMTNPNAEPDVITSGPDGALWFTTGNIAAGGAGCTGDNAIGRITTAGNITEFTAGISPCAVATGIVTGPDNNLWFTEFNANRIANITVTGTVHEFAPICSPCDPADPTNLSIITTASSKLWFAAYHSNMPNNGQIGVVTSAATGASTQYSGAFAPFGIAAGSDGALWFTEVPLSGVGSDIGRIPASGSPVTHYGTSNGMSAGAQPQNITAGPDGNLWFTDCNGGVDRIGRITTGGVITEFSAGITAASCPFGITTGPDGNIWFTEASTNALGRIIVAGATAGTVTEYPVPTPASGPTYIVTGPDHNLWFTEFNVGKIGRFVLPGASSSGGGTGSGSDCDKTDKDKNNNGSDKDKDKDKNKNCSPCKSKPNDKDNGRDSDKGCAA